MSGIYSTNKIKNLNQLNDVSITDLSGDEVLKYEASTGLWKNGTTSGVENLNDLNDVLITSVANDEVLKYEASSGKWINGTGGGGGGGTEYYFNARKDGSDPFRVTTANTQQVLKPNIAPSGVWLTSLETTGYNQFNTTSAEWTCPLTGLYNVSIRSRFFVDPNSSDTMKDATLYLTKQTGGSGSFDIVGRAEITDTYNTSTNDRLSSVSLQMTGIFDFNVGDKLRPEVKKDSVGNTLLKCGTGSYDPQFSIHKIA